MNDDNRSVDNQLEQDYGFGVGDRWVDDIEPVYATLHFYYNDPESMRRFRLCNQAENMKLALWIFDNFLRSELKYGNHETESGDETLRRVREEFAEIMNDHGIDLMED